MLQTSIERLDAPTRIKLRSTQILTSLPQIVSELAQNSLDAGALNIDIGVNCEEWTCWVKDDGVGISKDGLSLLGSGSEEGRYGSSKTYQSDLLYNSSTFGFRGEALASATDLSCLEISSRTACSRETWSIITKGGKNLYSGPAVRWRRETPGTVVCIRDAFYNLPVRRLSHPPPGRTLELIRQELETYALVFPNVAFTLENTHDEAGPSKGRILRIPRTSSTLTSFRNLYGRALSEHVELIDTHSGNLKLDGFLSLDGAHSKGYQFLYVNRHPLDRCDLHHVIDLAFKCSTFGKNALDETGEMDLPRSNVRRSPRKMERRPVYVLNLTVPTEEIDNCIEPGKSHIQFRQKDVVVDLISSIVEDFLIRNGFLTHAASKSRPSSNRNSPSPRKRRKVDVDDSGFAETMDIDYPVPRAGEYEDVMREPAIYTLCTSEGDPQKITWTDPRTGEMFIVDSHTGHSRPQPGPLPVTVNGNHEVTDYCRQRRTISSCHTTSKATNATNRTDIPHWLQKALQANKTYQIAENAVPKLLPSVAPTQDTPDGLSLNVQDHYSSYRREIFQHFLPPPSSVVSDKHQYRFKKDDLQRVKIINQVDRKFIACLIEDHPDASKGNSPSSQSLNDDHGLALVLIDQHAADERVRVEQFLKDLCLGFLHNRDNEGGKDGIRLRELLHPTPILLTLHEARKLQASAVQLTFRHWGFHFTFPDIGLLEETLNIAEDNSGYTQVLVKSIPEVVGDKLLLGDELRDLVKGFLGQLELEMPPTSTPATEDTDDEFSWLKALRWCPRELLDLVNSKACRGAIMFNDSLSISQCEELVRRLSKTAFPFQCAHGRPSLVPLTNIGLSATTKSRRKEKAYEWERLDPNVNETEALW